MVSRMDEVEIEGTRGRSPNPNNRFKDARLGELEQNSSRSVFRSLASEWACVAGRKSSHGFAELAPCKLATRVGVMLVDLPDNRNIDIMFIHKL